MKTSIVLLFAALTAASPALAADISYPLTQTNPGCHPFGIQGTAYDFRTIGQSFTATASHVYGGLWVADINTMCGHAFGTMDVHAAASINLRIELRAGEGLTGTVLHSTTRMLTAPFSGFVDVDYNAAGVVLTVGQKYTFVLTDISGVTYPRGGGAGWYVPMCVDTSRIILADGLPDNTIGWADGPYLDGIPFADSSSGTGIPVGSHGTPVTLGDHCFRVIQNG